MPEIVFLNGKLFSAQQAKSLVFKSGLLSGWGLFETMRAYRQRIVYFSQHLKRIQASCQLIQMECPQPWEKIKEIIQRIIAMSQLPDAYVRLTFAKAESGTDTLLIVKKYRPYPPEKYKQGFRVAICKFRQDESSFLTRIKTTSRIFYELAYLQAKKAGFDDALILNQQGEIAECSRSNVFLIKDSQIFTPALVCGCLEGITRKVIFAFARGHGIKINTGRLTAEDLRLADEAFLTNSLMGVMPLTYLEKKRIGKSRCIKLTSFFIEKYSSLLN